MTHERDLPRVDPDQTALIDYETLLLGLPVVVYQSVLDPARDSHFRTIYISEYIERILGYRAEELLADPDLYLGTIVHPEDRERILGMTRASAETFETQTTDYRLIHRDGRVIWIRDHRGPRPMDDGRTAMQGIILDISSQRAAEAEREAADLRLRTFVERIPSVVYVDEVGSKRPFLYLSPQIEAMTGYAAHEFYADAGLFRRIVHPDDVGAMLDGYGEPGRRIVVEYRILHRDGGVVWIRDEGLTVADRSAGQSTIYGTITDITAQRIAEQALEQSEERYRNLIERLPLVVFVDTLVDESDGGPVYLSPRVEDLLGRPAEDFYADSTLWRSMVHPDDVGKVYAGAPQAGDGSETLTYRMTTARGRQIVVNEVTGPIVETPSGPIRQGYVADITERVQAADALRRTEKAESLAVLAGGIAHDFNNILVAILGNADLAAMELPEAHPARATIAQIKAASLRAADLARQMLAYSGRGRFIVEPVDLGAIATEMAELLQVAINRGVSLSVEPSGDLPTVEADPTGLRQVVMNLVVNAGEAIGDSAGRITVSTFAVTLDAPTIAALTDRGDTVPGRYVCLEVADTGAGMDRATVGRIFEPYFSTKFTGRGLGLAAVIGIIHAHHGAIAVESSPSRGTRFRVYLPASNRPIASERTALLQPTSRAATVLIVDDEPTVLAVAARMLERAGYRAIAAPDGETALAELASGTSIDVVLLDVTMPGLNGAEVHARIREIDGTVPVVAMSGFSEEETRQRFASVGPVGFIPKPFTPSALAEVVASTLAGER